MAQHRLYNLIEYIPSTENRYLLMDVLEGNAQVRGDLIPETPDWFDWLAKLHSFHFQGKSGHFTALQERKKRGETYWYAYRKAHQQRNKRYLGATGTLTLAHLEDVASTLHEAALGTLLADPVLNVRSQQLAPCGLTVGPMTFAWHGEVLEVTTPRESLALTRTQTAELLCYLYERRGVLLKRQK
jgi:hypothetical protein